MFVYNDKHKFIFNLNVGQIKNSKEHTPNSVNYFTHQKRLCVMSHSFGSPHQPQIKPIPFTTKTHRTKNRFFLS